jgi:hypothetical protein
MFSSARGLLSSLIRAFPLVVGLSSVARADETAAWPNVDRRLGSLFPLAVAQSAARLETPECAAVLGDFRDNRTGRPLTERLAETGEPASEYLARWLTFTSGTGLRPCANSERLAFTSPGSRVVFVCRDQFDAMWRKNEGLAVNILIHEALHSLGLGENPPDSKFITARVQARCGR